MRIFEVRNRPGCAEFCFRGTWKECAKAIQSWYGALEDYDEDGKRIVYEADISESSIDGDYLEIGEETLGAYDGANGYEWILTRVA